MAKAPDMIFANPDLAKSYGEFRPSPPESLIAKILEFTKESRPHPLQLSLDVGCGSGQNTELYAKHFERVIGIDVSLDQLEVARSKNVFSNISYQEGSDDALPAEDASVDLVTACVACHWFNLENFYLEVDRILKPGGVLACYSYFGVSPIYKGKSFRKEFVEIWDMLNDYFSKGHDHLRTDYADLPQLYSEDFLLRGFSVEEETNLDAIFGYITSLSAFTKMKKAKGEKVADEFVKKCRERMLSAMGTDETNPPVTRRYDYFLRIWRKPVA